MNTDKYYDTTAFEHFYDILKRRICKEHDRLSFMDDRRGMFVRFLSILNEEYDEFSEELSEELRYFDVCGRFTSDEVFDGEGNFLLEIEEEARKFAHTFPAYSDAAYVYWEYIDRLSKDGEDD